jgi:hypothetical protein
LRSNFVENTGGYFAESDGSFGGKDEEGGRHDSLEGAHQIKAPAEAETSGRRQDYRDKNV